MATHRLSATFQIWMILLAATAPLAGLCRAGEQDGVVPVPSMVEGSEVFQAQYSSPLPPPSKAPVATNPPPSGPKSPFSPQMFDNNFSYKQKPDHDYVFGEELKDMPLATLTGRPIFDETTVSTGGELRFRYIDELNRLRVGGPGKSSYDQWRWRHYIDVKHSDWIRAYVEMIDASINHQELPLQGIDENRWDLQNYFVDVKVPTFTEDAWWFRIGRQELLYGSQRLVSPLDWSNIRRNFEGMKLFTRRADWDIDAWIVNPVNTATPGAGSVTVNDNKFDQRNTDYVFGGLFATYKAMKDQTFDLFFLGAKIDVPTAGLPHGERYTLGTRWFGNLFDDRGQLIQAEVEGGYQFGNDRSALYDAASPRATVSAGYFTAGAGHTWKANSWQPSLWWYWDWASGDNNPSDGQNNTFFQHVGFFHYYLGQIDNISRQNINDVNVQWSFKPGDPMQVTFAHHWFQLANSNDVLYNVVGTPVGTPDHGSDVGHEFDFTINYNVSPNWSLQWGYFWFWYGGYVEATAPRGDAQQVYVMSTLRY